LSSEQLEVSGHTNDFYLLQIMLILRFMLVSPNSHHLEMDQ